MKNTMIQKQRFGVEVEMTGLTRKSAAESLAKTFGTVIGHIDHSVYNVHSINDQNGRTWKIMRDSSINPTNGDDRCKVEMVTPILEYEDIELLQTVIRNLREKGAKTNRSCGIHVHVDGANHNPGSLRRLLNLFVGRQDLIYEALEITDRANSWCHKISPTLLRAMKRNKDITKEQAEATWYSRSNDGYRGRISHEHYNETRYHGVNLHAFFSKGTVEFRLFNSTLHAGKIKAYIQFCLAMSGWAILSKDNLSFKNISSYTPEQKVNIMLGFLKNRLGLTGREFKTCRIHLLAALRRAAGIATMEEAA